MSEPKTDKWGRVILPAAPSGLMVWHAKLDDAYDCTVTRTGQYAGQLKMLGPDGAVLVDEPVSLAYGAAFGPDVDDVQTWQARCIAAVPA